MDSRGEKRGVKRDRSMSSRSDRSVSSGSYRSVSSSASSSTLTPPKAKKIKHRVREHSELHQKKCRHNFPVFSTESTMLSLESKSCEMCSTGRCKRSTSWGSEMMIGSMESIVRSAKQLSVLLREDKITLRQAMHATNKFKDNYFLRILWLKMTVEHQIKYVQGSI